MAHEHHHGITAHGPGHAAPAPFTEAELHTFHANDRKEGTVVIALITSIFTIGVVIYTIVASVVYANPNTY
jgi:hypothetical protein